MASSYEHVPFASLPPLPAKRVRRSAATGDDEEVYPTSSSTASALERGDGRALYEMRRIYMKTGVLQRAEGSCYLSQGKTRIMCSVFGPKSNSRSSTRATSESQEGELTVEVTFLPFSHPPGFGRMTRTGGGSGQASRGSRETRSDEFSRLSNCLVQTFQSVVLTSRFPNASVEVCLLVIQNDGSLLSAATNAVSLGLADARIPMKDVCASVSVCLYDVPLLSPSLLSSSSSSKSPASTEHKRRSDGLLRHQEDILQRPTEDAHSYSPNKIVNGSHSISHGPSSLGRPQHRELSSQQHQQQPIFLVDPTLDELTDGPLQLRHVTDMEGAATTLDAEGINALEAPLRSTGVERCYTSLHLTLCAADLSVAFLDVSGPPLEGQLEIQMLQLAENACCATATAFKEQLKTCCLRKQVQESSEAQLTSRLVDIVKSVKQARTVGNP